MAKMRQNCVLLVFSVILVDILAVRVGERAETLHLAKHLQIDNRFRRPIEIEVNKLSISEENIGEFLASSSEIKGHSIHKRGAPLQKSHQPNCTTYALNDSHTQLIVHWAGRDSDVIIILSKNQLLNIGTTNNVFVSKDYGKTFTKINEKLVIPNFLGSTQPAVIDHYYNSPVYISYYIFVDVQNNYVFTTTDYGDTVNAFRVYFTPRAISFHPSNPYIALAIDTDDTSKKLYLTRDFGATWTYVQAGIKSFFWEDSQYGNEDCLYLERLSSDGESNVLVTCDFFVNTRVLISHVLDFELKDNYMFATKKVHLLGSQFSYTLQLWVSYQRGPFYHAKLPHELQHVDFYVADASEDQVFLCVDHNQSASHLYVSDVNGTRFSLSLENILYFNPNGSNKDSWLSYYKDESFADIERINGMRGVYIASQLTSGILSPNHQRSLITFDKGGEWQLLKAPAFDWSGRQSNCSKAPDCSLHVTQEFHFLYPGSRTVPVLSRSSAPGLVLATGSTGNKLGGMLNVYLSTDAGLNWREVLEGKHYFSMGDYGGILVAVKQFTPTNQIVYSTDEGETWNTYNFTDTPIIVYGVLTEPGEKTPVFFLFGSNNSFHSWKVVSINMTNVFFYVCQDSDYKMWSMMDNTDLQGCLLGRKLIIERRIPRTNCYNGLSYDRDTNLENCSCTREDFECDFGFMPENASFSYKSTRCIPDHTMDDDIHSQPNPCPVGTFYPFSRGYRKVSGDTCEGGDEQLYAPLMYSCRAQELQEFILYSTRREIHRYIFGDGRDETLVEEGDIGDVVAIDFDYLDNCIFWGDNSYKLIKRLCLDGNHSVEVLHNSSIEQIEGLEYDWLGGNIYWIDAKLKTLEVSMKNGSFRRHLFKGAPILDKPRALALDPGHGWMYWTDWSESNPRIVKAYMDGQQSSVKVIVNGTGLLQFPNGITIDYQTARLYWTDAGLDRIMSCDMDGRNITTILNGSFYVPHPYSIGIYKNNMYWTDWVKKGIMAADKFHGYGFMNLTSHEISGIMDMKVLSRTDQQGNGACSNRNGLCSELCLSTPVGSSKTSNTNRTCRCSDNTRVSVIVVGSEEQCCLDGHINPLTRQCLPINSTMNCMADQFTCRNSHCIPATWKCDEDDDCGDMSDELNCPYKACSSDEFQCDSGRCIPKRWRCDFDNDCHDNSDERGCVYPSCNTNQFKCDNGRCINATWRCDLDNDCRDFSDEKNCTNNGTICEEGSFTCSTGFPLCISAERKCDGNRNCADGSDEQNCTSACPSWKLTCKNGHCVYLSWRCDGDNDCGDGTDEQNCSSTSHVTTTTTTTTQAPFSCHFWQFQCRNGRCVWWTDKCDGINDCGDYSDEEANCPPRYNLTTPSGCRSTEFQCGTGQCVLMSDRCDGGIDCADGSDEQYCYNTGTTTSRPFRCNENQFKCKQQQCIPQQWVCDGRVDCLDGEDEKNCTIDSVCTIGQFRCMTSEGCIPLVDVCNGVQNCADGSDEYGCFPRSTAVPPPVSHCGDRFLDCGGTERKCVQWLFTCDAKFDCDSGIDEQLPVCYHLMDSLDLNLDKVNAENVTLSWGFTDPTANFTVSYMLANQNSSVQNVTTGNMTKMLVKLKPVTEYIAAVYARVKNSTVYKSRNLLSFITKEGVPGSPDHVHVYMDDSSQSIVVNWTEPAVYTGRIIRYRVYYEKTPDSTPSYMDHEIGTVLRLYQPIVQIGKHYEIWVTAFTSAGEGSKSITMNVTFDEGAVTKHVENLMTTNVTSTSLVLSWTAPADQTITNYTIHYEDARQEQTLGFTKAAETQFKVEKLCPGTAYEFEVEAKNTKSVGPPTTVYIKTSGQGIGKPNNINVIAINTNAVNVSWLPPDGINASETYTVYYTDAIDYRKPSITGDKVSNSSSTYLVIDNLSACQTYYFQVAVTGTGVCPLSELITFQTGSDDKASVKDIQFTPLNKTAGNLTWLVSCPDAPFIQPMTYRVYITELANNYTHADQPFTNSNLRSMTYMISGLAPGANFSVQIKTVGVSATQSAPFHFQTEKFEAPENFYMTCNSEPIMTCNLGWERPMEIPEQMVMGYEVYMLKEPEGKKKFEQDNDYKKYPTTSNTLMTVANLQSGYHYRFKVCVVTTQGYTGKFSFTEEIINPGGAASSSSQKDQVALSKTNLVAIVVSVSVIVIALVVFLTIFIVRHRRLQRSFLAYARSHYDTRSGTTTLTAADDLGEDEEPLIRGFSDDEPLVIA